MGGTGWFGGQLIIAPTAFIRFPTLLSLSYLFYDNSWFIFIMFIAINTFKISFSLCIFLKCLEFKSYLGSELYSFFKRIMRTDPGWKLTNDHCTVQHFVAEGVTKSTIYHIITRYRATGTTKHRKGAGRPRRIMTSLGRARRRKIANHRTVLLLVFPAVKVLKQLRIRCRRRMKVPRYKDGAAIREAKKWCRRLYNKFKNLDFVIDDEKYFRLSGFQMAGNWSYYTCDKERTPIHVKTYSKKKFEPKVMLWIAISPKGISTPVITSGRGMAVKCNCRQLRLKLLK